MSILLIFIKTNAYPESTARRKVIISMDDTKKEYESNEEKLQVTGHAYFEKNRHSFKYLSF